MTTDVTWGMFDQVRRPAQWATLLGRITYMMEREFIPSYAELARRALVNERQVPNQLRRLAAGGDLQLETVKALAKGLNTSVGWLGNDEGWPNEEIRKKIVEGSQLVSLPTSGASATPPHDRHRTKTPAPPARAQSDRPKSTK